MKKKFIYFLLAACITGFLSLPVIAVTSASESALIRQAVNEYKKGNYINCISILRKVTNYDVYHKKDATGYEHLSEAENNAVAWYYLGSSYMKIGLQDEADAAFDRVVSLNQSPKLTSYAIQAKLCIKNGGPCKYYNLKYEEIQELKADPEKFFDEYTTEKVEVVEKDPDTIEIERLIQGQYGNNIHPEAQNFINDQKMQRKQNEMNQGTSQQ